MRPRIVTPSTSPAASPGLHSSPGNWLKIAKRNELSPILEPGDWVFAEDCPHMCAEDLVICLLTNGRKIYRRYGYASGGFHHFYNGRYSRSVGFACNRVVQAWRITAMLRCREVEPLPWANLKPRTGLDAMKEEAGDFLRGGQET